MEVFSPVAALAAGGESLFEESKPVNSNQNKEIEMFSDNLYKSDKKKSQTDTRNKEEVHKKTSNKAKETGKLLT